MGKAKKQLSAKPLMLLSPIPWGEIIEEAAESKSGWAASEPNLTRFQAIPRDVLYGNRRPAKDRRKDNGIARRCDCCHKVLSVYNDGNTCCACEKARREGVPA